MATLGGLLSGSKSSSNSSSTSVGSSTTTSSQQVVEKILAGDAGSKDALDQLMGALLGSSLETLGKSPDSQVPEGYTKADAINDSKGLVDSIFSNFKSTALPQIYKQQTASGGYNSTGAQLLANDAYGKAVAAGQEATLGNIKSYADITAQYKSSALQQQSTALQALLGVLGLQQSAIKTSTQDADSTSTTNSTSSTTSTGTTKAKSYSLSASFSPEKDLLGVASGGGPK